MYPKLMKPWLHLSDYVDETKVGDTNVLLFRVKTSIEPNIKNALIVFPPENDEEQLSDINEEQKWRAHAAILVDIAGECRTDDPDGITFFCF